MVCIEKQYVHTWHGTAEITQRVIIFSHANTSWNPNSPECATKWNQMNKKIKLNPRSLFSQDDFVELAAVACVFMTDILFFFSWFDSSKVFFKVDLIKKWIRNESLIQSSHPHTLTQNQSDRLFVGSWTLPDSYNKSYCWSDEVNDQIKKGLERPACRVKGVSGWQLLSVSQFTQTQWQHKAFAWHIGKCYLCITFLELNMLVLYFLYHLKQQTELQIAQVVV